MRKIISFFILVAILSVSNFYNVIMAFDGADYGMQDNMLKTNNCGEISNSNTNSNSGDCAYSCFKKVNFDKNFSINSNEVKIKKDLFSKLKNTFQEFIIVFFDNTDKSILKINSPPGLDRELKNYSYINLIKIIKSNT
ncbi:MAG: hypothetical protein PHE25_03000 [Candidatus Gracilibacteria bacterium]|nr:hypothetical protein [Candidatus Gracilibacteria bacterium]